LDSIAFATLGDRTQWRMIADANGIYNPISFPDGQWVGRTIAIPDTHGESYDPGEASDYV
jgi:nucleoid-associated protein YgaU